MLRQSVLSFFSVLFSVLAVCATAEALPLARPDVASSLIEVRALRTSCICRVRVRSAQKRIVIVGYVVTKRREHRTRQRRYDMPSIPPQK